MIDGRANELPDYVVFRTVVKYCFVIIVVPVVSFFLAKGLFHGIIGLDSITSSVYSAAVTVIVLHLTLGLYIYRAWIEGEKTEKPVKKD